MDSAEAHPGTGGAGKESSADCAAKAKTKEWMYPGPGTGKVSTFWAKKITAEDLQYAEAGNIKLSARASSLRGLVAKDMEEAPYEYRGLTWSKRPISWFSAPLGFSARHTDRLIKQICARRLVIRVEQKKTMLIRVGGDPRLCQDDLARIMVKIWKQSTGRNHSAKEYGMLHGLAQDWPYPYGPDLFTTTIDNWAVFMAGVKQYVSVAKVTGDFYEPSPGKYHDRYLRHPSISVIRRFWPVAAETYVLVAGDQSKVPEEIQNVQMSI